MIKIYLKWLAFSNLQKVNNALLKILGCVYFVMAKELIVLDVTIEQPIRKK